MRELEPGLSVTPSIRLVRRLGAGGMGSVWLAEHQSLRTQVVVKFMAIELAASAEATERFSREAAAAAQVKSPHVVQMLDHGITGDGIPFIVMELLEGEDLGKFLGARGRLTIQETAEIIGQVCKALLRAHERGIVHRDIKPDNIFMCSGFGEMYIKLLDFGIAKGDGSLGGSTGTKTGAMIGTPYYMSPEQIVGLKSIDYRTDLWSLGVVAYECVVGMRPFDEEVFGALAIRIHSGPIPVPSQVDPYVPPAFDGWFARACARDVSARFGNAKEMADTLAQIAALVGPQTLQSPVARTAGPSAAPQATPYPVVTPSGLPQPAFANTPHFAISGAPIPGSNYPPPYANPGASGMGGMSHGASGMAGMSHGASGMAGMSPVAGRPSTNGGVGLATHPPPQQSSGRGAAIASAAIGVAVLVAGGAFALKHFASAPTTPAPAVSAAPSSVTVAVTAQATVASSSASPVLRDPPAVTLAAPTTGGPASLVDASAVTLAAPGKARPVAGPAAAAPPRNAPAAPVAPAPPAAAPASKGEPNCNPPFFFDAKGNRVFKPECL
jgi:serine/threonine-protein kinase